jgi:CDP-paratose 2-epimerase
VTVAIVTGSAGLIGAETVRFFAGQGLEIVGIDNDMRSYFFGKEASTAWSRRALERDVKGYRHVDADIRDIEALRRVLAHYGHETGVIVHTAAQPSHDWAAREPLTDFGINAGGTLNLLELTRELCPQAVFIYTSTNKVYGDAPNRLPLVEQQTRWELSAEHPYAAHGIDELLSVDQNLHSLFGASKLAADILVQEYGRYFGLRTACFRGGCLTGPGHSGAELHGFLAYLMKCALTQTPYTVYGYGGKQVRDNIHSYDLVNAFWHVFRKPRSGEVYNIGGGRHANCSMLEAIAACERLTGKALKWKYSEDNRIGDHIWWISDIRKFESHYPAWRLTHDMDAIYQAIYEGLSQRLAVKETG